MPIVKFNPVHGEELQLYPAIDEYDLRYLLLDQTTPQTIINGAPIFNAGIQVNAASSSSIAQIVKAAASQSANLTEWQNSSGGVLALMGNNGQFTTQGTDTSTTGTVFSYYLNRTFAPTGTGSSLYMLAGRFIPKYTSTFDSSAGGSFLGGGFFNPQVTSSGVVNLRAVDALTTNAGSGTISTADGVRIRTPQNTGGGAITTARGLYIEDQNVGGTAYSIYTNAGINRFGDQLSIVGSADRIQQIIKANATQTTNLTEWQNSSGGVLASVEDDGAIDIPYIAAGNNSTTDPNIIFSVNHNFTNPSGTVRGGRLLASSVLTANNANIIYGIDGVATHSSGAFNLTASLGLRGFSGVAINATAGTVTGAVAHFGQIQNNSTGTITNAYTIRGNSALNGGGGTITNLYGLYLQDMVAGSTLNYAIYTNAGIVHMGDKVEFTQTDGNEYIDSLADGYMDYRATTAHRFGDGTNQLVVESDGDTYWEGTGGLDFAQIYEEDGSSTMALAAQDTYYQVTAFSANGESNGMTPDHTNDHITVARTGKYLATIDISFYQTTAVAIEYDFHLHTNNGANDFTCISAHRDSGGATTVGNTTSTGIVSLTSGDTVELWVKRLDGGAVSTTIGIVAAMITLVQVGG